MRILILLLIIPFIALGEESSIQPCVEKDGQVVCQKAGFDKLVHKLVDARTEAQKCAVLLADEKSLTHSEQMKGRISSLIAIVSTAVLLSAAVPSLPTEARVVSAAAGITGSIYAFSIIW